MAETANLFKDPLLRREAGERYDNPSGPYGVDRTVLGAIVAREQLLDEFIQTRRDDVLKEYHSQVEHVAKLKADHNISEPEPLPLDSEE